MSSNIRIIPLPEVHLPASAAVRWWKTELQPGKDPPSTAAAVNAYVAWARSQPKLGNLFVKWVPTGIFQDVGVGKRVQKWAPLNRAQNIVFFDDDGGRIYYSPRAEQYIDRLTRAPVHNVEEFKFKRLTRVGAASIGRAFLEGQGFGSRMGVDIYSGGRERRR